MVSMNIGLHLLNIMLFYINNGLSININLSIVTLHVLQMEVWSSNAPNPLNTLTVPLLVLHVLYVPIY